MIWLFGIALVLLVGSAVGIARRLDEIHGNVVKSRVALERALIERASAALSLAKSGELDVASSLLLADIAAEALEASSYALVVDGLDEISGSAPAKQSADRLASNGPDRLLIESELSRAIGHVIGDGPASETLSQACLKVQMTRRFHNNHVWQARRVRKHPFVRVLHLAGRAPLPQAVNLDDRSEGGL